jgi:hypothetical protein
VPASGIANSFFIYIHLWKFMVCDEFCKIEF